MHEATHSATFVPQEEVEKVLQEVLHESMEAWGYLSWHHLSKKQYPDYTYGSVLRTLLRNKPEDAAFAPCFMFGKEGFSLEVTLGGTLFRWVAVHDDSYLYLQSCSVKPANEWMPLFHIGFSFNEEEASHPILLQKGIEIWNQPFVIDNLPEDALWRVVEHLDAYYEKEAQ